MKKAPIGYRLGVLSPYPLALVCTYWGVIALGALLEGVGLLVGVIGVGTLIAGYLYPNTSQEITHAVERFEGE